MTLIYFFIKLLKNFYNFLFSFKIYPTLKTTDFRLGKQTTFICGRCGNPFKSDQWEGVILEYLSRREKEHLISNYFKVLKFKKFYRGVSARPQIWHYASIKDRKGELMSCSGCDTLHFQNLYILKILDINLAVVL